MCIIIMKLDNYIAILNSFHQSYTVVHQKSVREMIWTGSWLKCWLQTYFSLHDSRFGCLYRYALFAGRSYRSATTQIPSWITRKDGRFLVYQMALLILEKTCGLLNFADAETIFILIFLAGCDGGLVLRGLRR